MQKKTTRTTKRLKTRQHFVYNLIFGATKNINKKSTDTRARQIIY